MNTIGFNCFLEFRIFFLNIKRFILILREESIPNDSKTRAQKLKRPGVSTSSSPKMCTHEELPIKHCLYALIPEGN